MAAPKAVISAVKAIRTSKRADKSSRPCSQNLIERLPSEILIKILSYLDVAALFTISHVSCLFYQLASDNALWHKIFLEEFGSKRKQKPKCVEDLLMKNLSVDIRDQAIGCWKWLYFKTVAHCDMYKWKKHLRVVSHHTGLPSQTEQVLRNLNVTWELTVFDKSKMQSTLDLSWFKFSETSVTLCWSSRLPDYQHISTLQLHGVRRIALSCSGLKKPASRSLMVNLDMATVTKTVHIIGQDRLVQLKLPQPGLVVGIWKDQCSVAFVMFTLHFNKLVERSTQGSSVCSYVEPMAKPPYDDIDREYGLHGYHLHIALHNTKYKIMSESFTELFCRKTQMCDGFIQLTAINRNNLSQHTPLSGSITFPWKCEALQGTVESCCIMTLTLLDEFKNPFWYVCSPVCLKAQQTDYSYSYDGDHFMIHYQDMDGHVKMNLVQKEQKQYIVISLVLYIATAKINYHFGTSY